MSKYLKILGSSLRKKLSGEKCVGCGHTVSSHDIIINMQNQNELAKGKCRFCNCKSVLLQIIFPFFIKKYSSFKEEVELNNGQIDFLDCYDKGGSLVIKCPECGGKMYSVSHDTILPILKKRVWHICKECNFEQDAEKFKNSICCE